MYSWAVERISKEEDRDKFEMDLVAPIPGARVAVGSSASVEEETSTLMQFGAEFGASTGG